MTYCFHASCGTQRRVPPRAVQVHRRVLELGARVQTLHAMHERTDEKLAAMDEKPSPATHAIWAVLEAGETVYLL